MRALISVWDKNGVAEFACGLSRLGFELVSSGGTADFPSDYQVFLRSGERKNAPRTRIYFFCGAAGGSWPFEQSGITNGFAQSVRSRHRLRKSCVKASSDCCCCWEMSSWRMPSLAGGVRLVGSD